MDQSSPPHSTNIADGMVRSAVDAVLTIDDSGIICSANPAAAAQFGYKEDELIGRNVSMLMPEPDRSNHDAYVQSYTTTGRVKIIGIGRDVVGERKNGTLFPMHLSVSEFHADGRRLFTGIIHDLTARKQIENELRQQRALFQSIFNHVPDAMAIADKNCKVTLCNPALTKLFGYQTEEVIGHTLRKCFADDQDYEHARLGFDFTEDGSVAGEASADPVAVALRRKAGDAFPGQLVRSVIKDEAGQVVGILLLIRDVSAEVEREEALRHTQRMEAIGQLTGGIAHDFNNLLTVISGNHELLEMRLKEQKNRDLLRRADEAAQMGARLTNRLLAFARRGRLDPAIVQLNDLVVATLELLPRALGGSIVVLSRLAPDLWQTKADASEVENAILNLAINARDAMPANGALTIETANSTTVDRTRDSKLADLTGDFVRLSVIDNGVGMSPQVLSRVFEPFFTTKETGRGTGLGLSTLYGFAQQSGGHVTIQSVLGKGTTVNLYLPRYINETAQPAGQIKQGRGIDETESTILVVEDNLEVQTLAVERLRALGYRVVCASYGRDAIEIIRSGEQVDLVFSDIVMPGGVSGFDLAEWVSKHNETIPIVLTTGYTDQLQARAGEAGSRYPILRKPYSREELANEIAKALG